MAGRGIPHGGISYTEVLSQNVMKLQLKIICVFLHRHFHYNCFSSGGKTNKEVC